MPDYLSTPCTAFAGVERLARGALIDVALAVKAAAEARRQGPVITFNDTSGRVIDLDLRGTTAEIISRLTAEGEREARALKGSSEVPARSRGRPKLGVVAREITLLPRHWEWLGRQPGGASQALRRLVDEARLNDGGQTDQREAEERTYRFLSALAGNLPGFEEAIRALFSDGTKAFAERMTAWPPDIRDHALMLAQASPENES
jgi:hypothetical protein